MHRIDTPDNAAGLFQDGDPLIPRFATYIDAAWANAVQENIVQVILAAGIALVKGDHLQLLEALRTLGGRLQVYAGNPNGHVAGVQGDAAAKPQVFPSMCWDTTNTVMWVCTTTGNAAAAVWVPIGDDAEWPYVCTQTGGTANAPVLTTPAIMDRLVAGTRITWQITTGPSTDAVNVTVGAFGAKALYKDGPAGPEAVGANGELDIGNYCAAIYDGVKLHLLATEMGTAALANASSNTGTVAAVSGAISVNHIAVFADASGTVKDGGPLNVAGAPKYLNEINNGELLNRGGYIADTRNASFSIILPPAPSLGDSIEIGDCGGAWEVNPLTVQRNGNTIMGSAEDLICNISGEDFRIWFNGVEWTLN